MLWYVSIQLCQHYLLERLFFPHFNGLDTPMKSIDRKYMGLFLDSVPLICMTILMSYHIVLMRDSPNDMMLNTFLRAY